MPKSAQDITLENYDREKAYKDTERLEITLFEKKWYAYCGAFLLPDGADLASSPYGDPLVYKILRGKGNQTEVKARPIIDKGLLQRLHAHLAQTDWV